ncbi:MAG: hypothetical protein JXA03_10505 [Bacteroidales bacterium]|nr:hypothetical protein [Bacteroidales bacterium]
MAKLNKRLPAYTLIETLVSSVILVVVFGIGMMIFMHTLSADMPVRSAEVFFKAQEALHTARLEGASRDMQYQYRDFTIELSIMENNACPDVKTLWVRALDNRGRTIYEKKEIYYPHFRIESYLDDDH